MRVAAYQAPLEATGSADIVDLIGAQIAWCGSNGIEILCCPEAVLGGLADYASSPADVALHVGRGELQTLFAPLASHCVTTILGFTEVDDEGRFFNSAAVLHEGRVAGIYRKLHPAIHRSVYAPGDRRSVFSVGALTFGILICRDSSYAEPARTMTTRGATVLFVPSNNGLPPQKTGRELVVETRRADVTRAVENGVYVVRADVAGNARGLVACGTSEIVDPSGRVLRCARQFSPGLIVADIHHAGVLLAASIDAST